MRRRDGRQEQESQHDNLVVNPVPLPSHHVWLKRRQRQIKIEPPRIVGDQRQVPSLVVHLMTKE